MTRTITISAETYDDLMQLLNTISNGYAMTECFAESIADEDDLDTLELEDTDDAPEEGLENYPTAYAAEKALLTTIERLGLIVLAETEKPFSVEVGGTRLDTLGEQELTQAAWNYRSHITKIGDYTYLITRNQHEQQ